MLKSLILEKPGRYKEAASISISASIIQFTIKPTLGK